MSPGTHWAALVATPAPTPSAPDGNKQAMSGAGVLFIALAVGLLIVAMARASGGNR